jgi:hypothetical protein
MGWMSQQLKLIGSVVKVDTNPGWLYVLSLCFKTLCAEITYVGRRNDCRRKLIFGVNLVSYSAPTTLSRRNPHSCSAKNTVFKRHTKAYALGAAQVVFIETLVGFLEYARRQNSTRWAELLYLTRAIQLCDQRKNEKKPPQS